MKIRYYEPQELYKIKSEFAFRVFYKNKIHYPKATSKMPKKLQIKLPL